MSEEFVGPPCPWLRLPTHKKDGTPHKSSRRRRYLQGLATKRQWASPVGEKMGAAISRAQQQPEVKKKRSVAAKAARAAMPQEKVARMIARASKTKKERGSCRGERNGMFGRSPSHENIEEGIVYLLKIPGVEGYKLGFTSRFAERLKNIRNNGFSNWIPAGNEARQVYNFPCRKPYLVEQEALAMLAAERERVYDLVGAVKAIQAAGATYA